MTQTRSRLHGLVALALTLALVVVAGIPAVTSGQDKAKNDDKGKAAATEPTPEPSPTPTPEPTPEPTPYPEFDPSTVTLRLDLYADDFDAPVFIADDGVPRQGCRYVVERGGLVKIIEASDDSTRLRPFLDISKQLEGIGPEQGLHSIAFHPGFRKNGRFFVHYTTAKNDVNVSVVAEFKGKACGRAPATSRSGPGTRNSRSSSTTTAAGSASGPTASSTSPPATAAARPRVTPTASARRHPRAWARCCASTSIAGTASLATIRT